MLKTLKWIINIIAIAVFVTLIVVSITGLMNNDNPRYVPGLGDYKIISIYTDSMKPVFQAGDGIIVKSSMIDTCKAGDIITYWRSDNGSLLTHRIVGISEQNGKEAYFTRGDANNIIDGAPVPVQDIVGKHICSVPHAGYFISYLHTKVGFLLLILLPIVLAVGLEGQKYSAQLSDYNIRKKSIG
ncbi:MAG: signal peptidase I [Bacillota bacterium]|nr:signal peptidase I [Gammaproteobacteria bacterium]